MKKEFASKVVEQDYRISRTDDGLTIEVLSYHAEPLTLTGELLREFGLKLDAAPRRRTRRRPSEDSTSV